MPGMLMSVPEMYVRYLFLNRLQQSFNLSFLGQPFYARLQYPLLLLLLALEELLVLLQLLDLTEPLLVGLAKLLLHVVWFSANKRLSQG